MTFADGSKLWMGPKAQGARHKAQGARHKAQGTRLKAQGIPIALVLAVLASALPGAQGRAQPGGPKPLGAEAPGAKAAVPRAANGKPDLSGTWVGGGFALLFGEAEMAAIQKADAAAGNFNDASGVTRAFTRDARMTERFTRIDAHTMRYEVTVDDPLTWTKPWTVAFPLEQDPSSYLFEFACHEGNYWSMRSMLGGARLEDRSGER